MTCHRCPYSAQIERLRRRCLACNCAESDGGTPHSRVRADEFTVNSVRKPVDFCRDPSEQATSLTADQEHRLRMAMTSLFGLDPIDLLLVQHLMQGRSLDSFGDTLTDISTRVRGYHGSSRAMAWARKEKILERMPQLRAVITTTAEADAARRIEDGLK